MVEAQGGFDGHVAYGLNCAGQAATSGFEAPNRTAAGVRGVLPGRPLRCPARPMLPGPVTVIGRMRHVSR